MARRINAPGIEVNEIDRSSYDETVDSNLIDTTTLVLGFADKGEDFSVQRMNSINQFNRVYGLPQTEAERYFYNSVYEIISRRGICYTAKLPYYNESLEKYVYTSYTIGSRAHELSSVQDILGSTVEMVDVGGLTEDARDDVQECQVKDLLFRQYAVDPMWQVLSAVSCEAGLEMQMGFLDYVEKMSNFSLRGQEVFRDVALSSNSLKRQAPLVIDGILSGTILPDSDGDGIRAALLAAFGEEASGDRILDGYLGELCLYEVRKPLRDVLSEVSDYTEPSDLDELLGLVDMELTEIRTLDPSMRTFVEVSADISSDNETMLQENYDRFLVKQLRPPQNKMYIVDTTRGKYDTDEFGNEVVGIMPVVVSPANALFYQEAIRNSTELLGTYNVISKVRNSFRMDGSTTFGTAVIPFDQTAQQLSSYDGQTRNFVGLGDYLGSEPQVRATDYTISQYAAQHFPTIKFIGGRLDRKYLGQIGLVVFKAFKDSANENRISFIPVESFVGSLDRNARDVDTGDRIFLDDVVNGNSDYINVFSNAAIAEGIDTDPLGVKNASIYVCRNQTACSMGFYQRDTWKNIHVTESIYKPMLKVFERIEDGNTLDVDILVDGGVSNIAQFIASAQPYRRNPRDNSTTARRVDDEFQRYGLFDFDQDTAHLFRLETANHVNVWKQVVQRFDDFAKNTRRDLIFIADGPRPFCLEGGESVIRRSRPRNTIKNTILPKMKFISGVINSSYSAGYLDWFWSLDHSSGEYMWLPPSIKAVGVYLYTDTVGAYWDAPAGLNRGIVTDTVGLAFNPTNDEAGQIYINSWNYAVNYPLDGIALEGQRTFQRDKTALDRVNVRRLMLGMEKVIGRMLLYFNYEGNTEFQRSRITDAVERYLEQVRANDGISEYLVVCDGRNNTQQTIENNELHVEIAVRPIKTIEFIQLNFMVTNQSVDLQEVVNSELGG